MVANDFTLRGRNAFFVAATRSRGWCFVSGNGNGIEKLQREIDSIQRDFPFFEFICPDAETVKSSRNLLRKSDRELDEIQRALSTILGDESLKKYVLDAIKRSDK
ncbi:hypothetical protein [Thiothrix subterranea]|uniref:hypothetical protein n=1 Tax=Thiothrix subterranea TaxID=2735563 RepID=UPI00280B8470|nr:hypothetical protein [Thiothrix subterranea]